MNARVEGEGNENKVLIHSNYYFYMQREKDLKNKRYNIKPPRAHLLLSKL